MKQTSKKTVETTNAVRKNQMIYQNVINTEHTLMISGDRCVNNGVVHYDIAYSVNQRKCN